MVRFENVGKTYANGHVAVADVNLEVAEGEFVCLIGPSGCGKTTTLKMVNRLIEPSAGTIYVNGHDIRQLDAVRLRRQIGYVIQQVGLFPHMTIRQNIEVVPQLLGWDAERRRRRVHELLNLVGMDPEVYANRYPRHLSGGQQQRVGVLRALAAEPPLILMDEPFGALDPITRETLQEELKNLQARLKKTILFVTHDMDEALKLADRIVLMKDGRVIQVASPEQLLRHPADEFVASFIGKHRFPAGPSLQTVEQVMNPRPVMMEPHKGVAEGLAAMRRHKVNSLLLVDDQRRLVGVVTLETAKKPWPEDVTLEALAATDGPCITPDAPAQQAFDLLLRQRLERLPVVAEDGRLVGLVTRANMVDAVSDVVWGEGGTGSEVSA